MLIDALKSLRGEKRVGVRFADGKGGLRRLSYSELIDLGCSFANGLFRKGVHTGEPVVLVMTNPESAVVTILGCMIAGCPPTPIYPPQNAGAVPAFLKFVKHVADRSKATLIVAAAQPYAFLGNVPHEADTLRGVHKFEAILHGDRKSVV